MKKYVNAKEVLPESLIAEIQVRQRPAYLHSSNRTRRDEMDQRNDEIFRRFYGGTPMAELAKIFNLSGERIRGIIYERQKD